MLVVNAHLVQDTTGEGFAVRLFRKGNQRGFVRALSDQPSSFVAGFNKVSFVPLALEQGPCPPPAQTGTFLSSLLCSLYMHACRPKAHAAVAE